MAESSLQQPLHIWGRMSSINVRKVVWAAQEVGVTFARTDAGKQFGIVNTPAYRALNPNSVVPTLQDGDVVLWESNVIVRYLCARYAPDTLYPLALAPRFNAERWMDWQQTTFNGAGGAAFLQWIRTPAEQRNHALIAQSVAAVEPLLAVMDAHLANQAYLAGDAFSMADIPLAAEIHRWFNLPQARPELPHVERWYQAILQRPATRGVLDQPLS
jgi:glutathione S-transferase